MFPWSDAPPEISRSDAASFAVGDAVYSGHCRGAVVSVDENENAMGVIWDDSGERYGVITYPIDATYLRKALPWE